MAEKPGELMDCNQIRQELGITRAAAEAIMRQLDKVQPPGLRKTYIKRADLDRLLRESTKVA